MAQGITIKGKTPQGKLVEVSVDDNGIVQISGDISVEPAAGAATETEQETQTALLAQIRGFDIPEYDEIELGYTGDNLTTVEYLEASAVVATLTLAYTGDKLTNVSIS